MLLGDSSVGKTCLLVRFKDGAFLGGNFIATVGIDFRVRDGVKQPQRLLHHAHVISMSCHVYHVMCKSTQSSECIVPSQRRQRRVRTLAARIPSSEF